MIFFPTEGSKIAQSGRSRKHASALLTAIIAIFIIAIPAASASAAAIVNNGTVKIGVRDWGDLNVAGGGTSYGSNGSNGTSVAGLRYMPTNMESTADGCTCEGWGVADTLGSSKGYANSARGSANLSTVSFTSSATTAVSVVNVTNGGTPVMRVTHDYHPATGTANLYEVTVTIEALAGYPIGNLRYRRVMDWDVQPTTFNEYVTVVTGTSPKVVHASNLGSAFSDPTTGYAGGANGNFTDYGPTDQGALFDFDFGAVAAGSSETFKVYFGAAGTETDALAALAAVNAEAYSLGQSSAGGSQLSGSPATFMFAFGGIGGVSIFNPEPVTSIGSGPELQTTSTSADFSFTSDIGGSTFECKLDDGAWAACASPASLTGLAAGDHVYYVRAIASGVTDPTPASYAWTVTSASTQPAATIVLPPQKVGNVTALPVVGPNAEVGCETSGTTMQSCYIELWEVLGNGVKQKAADGDDVSASKVGSMIGSATHVVAGEATTTVDVPLSKSVKRKLRRMPLGMKVLVKMRATGVFGDVLVSQTTAALVANKTSYLPVHGMFGWRSARLTKAAKLNLNRLAAGFGSVKRVRCEGHTSGPGDGAANYHLGKARAKAVCAYLVKRGVKAKTSSVSFGDARPAHGNRSGGGRGKNRRVELTVVR